MSSQPINADGLPSVSSTELSYYTVRDECVRAYQPATPEERSSSIKSLVPGSGFSDTMISNSP